MFEEQKAKLTFWYAKKFIKLNKHYEFMFDVSNADAFAVRILKKYPGVIVEISDLEMIADAELAYNINVVANPNLCKVDSKGFHRFTSYIICNMISSAVENAQREVNENRNVDSVKSNAQRVLHEESVAVSEERVPTRKPRKKSVRGNKEVRPEVQQSSARNGAGDQP
jgi:hypothetical protein